MVKIACCEPMKLQLKRNFHDELPMGSAQAELITKDEVFRPNTKNYLSVTEGSITDHTFARRRFPTHQKFLPLKFSFIHCFMCGNRP